MNADTGSKTGAYKETMDQKLNAIIVDPNPNTRANLLRIMRQSETYDGVSTMRNTEDALKHIRMSKSYDVLFVSSRLETSEIKSLIEDARFYAGNKDAETVLLVAPDEQDGASLAGSIVAGFDTFLFEPYSEQAVQQISAISANGLVTNQRSRFEIATRLLVEAVMTELDEKAEALSQGEDTSAVSARLKAACKKFEKLSGDSLDMYHEIVIELFGQAEPLREKEESSS